MNKLSNKDKIEISLIIDEDNKAQLELDKNTSEEKLQQICSSIASQYELPSKVEKRLFYQIAKEFAQIIKEKENKQNRDKTCKETIKRLYYSSINHEKEKRKEREKGRRRREEP